MLEQLLKDITALGALDWIVTLMALVYVGLSARNNPWCWPFGIISCALWAYVSFYQYDLYLDALLQVFYVIMGFVGWQQWLRGAQGKGGLPITRMKRTEHLRTIIIGLITGLLFGYAFSHTSAAATYWDAFTTTFSVLATILLIRRKVETWLYWIIIDLAYVGLYCSRGAILLAMIMLVYVLIAGFAYRRWITSVEPKASMV